MSKLRQVVDSFGRILSVIGTLCLLFIMMYIVCSVGFRFVTGTPFLGAFELGSTFLPLIAALYYVNTEIHGRHIRASIIFDRFSSKTRFFLDGLYSLLTAAIFFMVGWCVALFGIRNYQMQAETSVLALPMAPFLFCYSFVLVFFAIYMCFRAIDYFKGQTKVNHDELTEAF